ncbi:plant cysteine oxidase 2 [Carica papaya]|uniref:plant cysteine oxidase 2 n=1 Tax=Carica papaya TaxID=3649 RepID=UPI000B8C7DA5|nr:plant cysteine oxidase 2 [Carica papaya]
MGIGKTYADRKEELCESPNTNRNSTTSKTVKTANSAKAVNTSKSHNKGKRSRRRNKKMTALPIQRLFDICKEVFANAEPGIVPTPENIQRLRAVLDEINPEDVGLSPEMPYFCQKLNGRTPPITYLHLYESDKFSMGIFCLPPSGVIPLHNHPGMTVFSKLLFGTMHIKSYDWVADAPCKASSTLESPSEPSVEQAEIRLAKMKVDSNFTAPCNTSILYPADGGNMHCFTAVTPCAVLDVLGPPYSDPDGRHCTYYYDFPFANFTVDGVSVAEEEKEGHAWLQERQKLGDFAVVGALYRGPKIVDK